MNFPDSRLNNPNNNLNNDFNKEIDDLHRQFNELNNEINNGLEDNLDDSMKSSDSSSDLEGMKKSTIKNENTNFISVFKNMWSENELHIISSTFYQLREIKYSKHIKCEYQRRDRMDTYLNSIELIVRQKEKQVQQIILSTMTSY